MKTGLSYKVFILSTAIKFLNVVLGNVITLLMISAMPATPILIEITKFGTKSKISILEVANAFFIM